MRKNVRNYVIRLALSGFCLPACSIPQPKPEAMMPKQFNITHKHPYSTSVTVTGGHKTSTKFRIGAHSDISNEAFAQAIVDSIKQSGVFSSVISQGNSDYRLDVTLLKVSEPEEGFTLTVIALTKWRLTEAKSGKVVSEEEISTGFTATVGDSFAGITRLRIAEEGVARENIKEGIRRLSKLQLK